MLAAGLLAAVGAPARADGPFHAAADTLVYGDTDNVTVVSPQVSVRYALDEDGGEVGAHAAVDVVSAASVDVVASASTRFLEVRTEAGLDVAKAFGDHLPGLGYRISIEPDYVSHGVSGSWRARLGTPDTTLAASYGLTLDTIGRSGTPFDVWSRSLTVHAATLSLTQVLSTRWLARLTGAFGLRDGFMAKAYRHVALFDQAGLDRARADGVSLGLSTFDAYRLPAEPEEAVPDRRVTGALALRLIGYLRPIRGSIRVDLQGYLDSWGLTAVALEPVLAVELSRRLELDLFGRLYHQGTATFYRRVYVVDDATQAPAHRSADRDLSRYTAGSGGARALLRWEHLQLYAEGTFAYTAYDDFLYLDHVVALVGQAGLRWSP